MLTASPVVTLDDFFAPFPQSQPLFDALRTAIETAGPVDLRVTRSQVSFRRARAFAWAWVPDRYLGGGHALLVLSLVFPERSPSPRWKQIVEPAPGRCMHHLELRSTAEIDAEVRGWIAEAWRAAG